MADLGGGLSDFNLTTPNDSTSVDSGPSLSDMLGDAVLDEVSTSKLLSAKIDELEGKPQESILDKLLSPRGLALLAGSVGAGLAGGGLGGAAAFGLGGVQGVSQVAEAERSAQRAAIDKLEDKLEESQSRLDKSRNRIATAFNTNPEAFLDEDGNPVVDARVLGWYMTGTDIPLFPQTRRLLNQRDARWSKRMEFLKDALENTRTKEDATNIVRAMMSQLQWFNADEATVQSLVNSIGTEEFDSAFAATLLRNGGSSALDAMIFAGEEGLPLEHPEVLRRVKFQTDADQPPSQVLNQRFINALDTVNKFTQNPVNAEFVSEVKKNNSPEEASKLISAQALAPIGQGEIDFYQDRVNSMPPEDFRRIQQAYSLIDSKSGLIDTVRGAQNMQTLLGLDEEGFRKWKMEQAQNLVNEAEAAARQSVANQTAALRNTAAQRISGTLQHLGVSAVYQIVDEVIQAAMEDATNKDGTVDRAKFERLVDVYTQQAIDENKE